MYNGIWNRTLHGHSQTEQHESTPNTPSSACHLQQVRDAIFYARNGRQGQADPAQRVRSGRDIW